MRFSIMVRERYASRETELCQVDANPEAIVEGAQKKTLLVDGGPGRKVRAPKYEHVYFIDRAAQR